jgi:hypothetical protein
MYQTTLYYPRFHCFLFDQMYPMTLNFHWYQKNLMYLMTRYYHWFRYYLFVLRYLMSQSYPTYQKTP